jgi:hypothetical protein
MIRALLSLATLLALASAASAAFLPHATRSHAPRSGPVAHLLQRVTGGGGCSGVATVRSATRTVQTTSLGCSGGRATATVNLAPVPTVVPMPLPPKK